MKHLKHLKHLKHPKHLIWMPGLLFCKHFKELGGKIKDGVHKRQDQKGMLLFPGWIDAIDPIDWIDSIGWMRNLCGLPQPTEAHCFGFAVSKLRSAMPRLHVHDMPSPMAGLPPLCHTFCSFPYHPEAYHPAPYRLINRLLSKEPRKKMQRCRKAGCAILVHNFASWFEKMTNFN